MGKVMMRLASVLKTSESKVMWAGLGALAMVSRREPMPASAAEVTVKKGGKMVTVEELGMELAVKEAIRRPMVGRSGSPCASF